MRGRPSGRGWRDRCPRCAGRSPGQSAPGVPEKWVRKWPVTPWLHVTEVWWNAPHAHSGTFTLFPLPGCELSGHTRSFTFKVEEEDESEHVLALTMVRGGERWWW